MNKIQEFVQFKCVMAAHPKCKTLEKALEKDFLNSEFYSNCINFMDFEEDDFVLSDWYKGEPCTLSRVLHTFNSFKPFGILISNKGSFLSLRTPDLEYLGIKWKFLKEDGSDALFTDQTEETQLSIAKLLGYEE